MELTNYQIYLDKSTPVESLNFERLDNRYVRVCTISYAIGYLVLMGLALLLLAVDWKYKINVLIAIEAIIAVAFAVNMAFISKIYAFKGYALRQHDISYRSGIFFSSVVTVPFSKIQQVTVRQTPVSRIFDMYSVDIVNGSQSSMKQMSIPGLTKERAEQLKTMLISEADNDDR